jgi:hypothetical protein
MPSIKMLNVVMLSVIMLSVIAECCYAECNHAECYYAAIHYAESPKSIQNLVLLRTQFSNIFFAILEHFFGLFSRPQLELHLKGQTLFVSGQRSRKFIVFKKMKGNGDKMKFHGWNWKNFLRSSYDRKQSSYIHLIIIFGSFYNDLIITLGSNNDHVRVI